MTITHRFLSWGCGTQSTVLGEMAAQGILEPLDAIITADTGWERDETYSIRSFYTERWRRMGLHVDIINTGDIKEEAAAAHIHIPFWTDSGGPLQRQCTTRFKIRPIKHRMRELAGFHRNKAPHPKPETFEVWLGISLDEHHRAKYGPPKFQKKRWPLLELRMTRQDCIDWLADRDLPVPPKSACVCCPYRRASEWLELQAEEPHHFTAAIEFDEANRHNPLAARGDNSHADQLFLYKSNRIPTPIAEADFETDAANEKQRLGFQLPMTLCESGYCWT